CRRTTISHHLSQLYSVFFPTPFEAAAVLVMDGQGSPVHDFTEHWPGEAASRGTWREVSSFYACTRSQVRCLGKQLWECDDARPVGLGMFYFLLTQAIFPGEGHEGKVMGMAPYGNPSALGLPPLAVDRGTVFIPARWTALLADRSRFRFAA